MEKEIQKYLQKQYPNNTVELIGSGWSSYAFEVGENIIRVPRTDTKQYEKEIAILNFLQGRLPVQIPNPHIVRGDISYAEHKKINGCSWNIKTYNSLSEKAQNLFAKDIADFFATLHSIPLDNIYMNIPQKLITVPKLDSIQNFYKYLESDFSTEDIDIVYNWGKKILQPSDDNVLLHNDFWEANCLVDKNHRLIGVFDWANSHTGKPEWDFKSLYYPPYFPLLDKILDFYHQKTGRIITKNQIKTEKMADCLWNVQHFGRHPNLKNTMKKQWHETLLSMENTISAIRASTQQ